MKRSLLLVATASLLGVVTACSDARRAATAPPCIGQGCPNNNGVIGGGGGTNDAATDETASDGAFDVPEAGVPVTAMVRALARFTDDPATGAPVTMNIVLRAARMGGGATDSVVGPDGSYSLSNVAVVPGAPSNIAILQSNLVRANDGVWLPSAAILNLPLFNESLVTAIWPTLVPATVLPPNSAHLVIHIENRTTGTRMASVSATSTSADAKGPFYDDGSDVVTGRTATGARGTILFLGSTGTELSVTLASAKETTSFRAPLTPNVVTHFTAHMN